MEIFSQIGLFSLFKENFSLWISVYVIYTIIAAAPLLPFAGGIKKSAMGQIGQFGTYIFYFFVIVFITMGPGIIQSYFLKLTTGELVVSIATFVVFGVALFHLATFLAGKLVAKMTRSIVSGAVAAAALFFFVMVPLYNNTVWQIVWLIFSIGG